ncbi:MAG: hypothetical protein AzoDbin1_00918 [Azoarcus sp.]|nr:hypothetical protein [Azoarcus sp.]
MRLKPLALLIGSLLALAGPATATAAQPANTPTPAWPQAPKPTADAPNIVVVLLDDVGFAATGTFGGPTDTPALDRLAAEGLRYNQFHTTALCSPTRAALLSGRNAHRVGFGTVTEIGNSQPGYNAFWQKSVASLPEILRRSGYSTAAFGKWHNTPEWEVSPVGPFDRWPTGLGFDYFYGFMLAEASQWEPPLYRNTTPVEPERAPKDGYQVTTALVDDAIRWAQTHDSVAPDKPYFLYFAPGAAHAPHHVTPEWIAKYRGRFDQGWDRLREESFARQKALGVIPADAVLTPRPKELPAWDSLSAEQKKLYARQAEVYAAFLAQTDFEVGRLIETLRKGPKGDNTLVFYVVGDNGASAEGGLDGSEDNMAAVFSGLGTDVARQLSNIDRLGGPDFDNHFASAWAWAFDTPFQWTKQIASHFGGTRNPLVVSWPARIRDRGGLRSQFGHVNDIAPTIYDVLGIRFPEVVDGVAQEPLDGASLAASFADATAPSQHRRQYFELSGNRAIYKDGWVAAAFHAVPWSLKRSSDFAQDGWELYDVSNDFSQARDLADKHPEKLAELKALFDEEARRNKVFPLSNGFREDITTPDARRPSVAGDAREFVYRGDTPRLPVAATPTLLGAHRIKANIDVPADGGHGVILADGGRYGGFVLYAQDGRLVYEHNFFGRERTLITSTQPLPAGAVEVAFDYEPQGRGPWGGGIGRLTINGKPAGEGRIARVGLPSYVDTFDIGADRGSPVSHAYAAPGSFSGKVRDVTVTLKPAAPLAGGAAAVAAAVAAAE